MLVIALLAGAAGGLATGLLDGADRTRTAAERFISESRLLDAMVTDPSLTLEQTEQIRAIPGVRGASLLSGLALFPDNGKFINLTASLDGRWGTDLDVARIVRGRAVDPAAHDEIVLGEAAARALGVDVGDEARFNSWSPEQLAEWQESEPSEAEELTFLGPAIALKVVGISRHPADLSSDDPLSFLTALPFGVWQAYQGRVGEFGFRFVAVDLGDDPSPAEEAAVADAVRQIVGPAAAFEDAGAQAGGPLMTTLDFVAAALLALAAAVVVGGLVAVALLVLRTVARVAEETALLRALGMTGTEQARATTTALGPAAVAAGVITVAVAVLSSAFMPFGLARRAEPHPGIHVDGAAGRRRCRDNGRSPARAHRSRRHPQRAADPVGGSLGPPTVEASPCAIERARRSSVRARPGVRLRPHRRARCESWRDRRYGVGFGGGRRRARARVERGSSLHDPGGVRLDVGLHDRGGRGGHARGRSGRRLPGPGDRHPRLLRWATAHDPRHHLAEGRASPADRARSERPSPGRSCWPRAPWRTSAWSSATR